jgi:tetratricopeptide (TPR) repeat protein
MKTLITIVFSGFLVFTIIATKAQDMTSTTLVSQKSSITQRIGTTDITIDYHSPLAKGRQIFGGIVPYDFVVDGVEYPWRAGSNKNTIVEFSHDVRFNGQLLKKGKYGLHILVSKNLWVFIFSKNADNWGSFFYKKAEDALRVNATPEKAEFQEWLSYDFVDRQPESAAIELHWTDVRCKITFQVDVTANIIADLEAKEEKTAEDFYTLATKTYKQDPDEIIQAISYINESINIEETFKNKMFKAKLLMANGQKKEGKQLKAEAMAMGKDFDWYYYALSLLLLDKDKKAAFKVLDDQLKKDPNDRVVHLAMGEYYINQGNQEKAVYHFKRYYELSTERSYNYGRYLYLSNQLILERQQIVDN